MRITLFASLWAGQADARDIEWADLCNYLANPPEFPTKEACPLIKLGQFGAGLSDKGSPRFDANVEFVSGVEVDYDGEVITPTYATGKLQQAGIAGIVYTSPSHTAAKPRWRILAPLSQNYHPTVRRELAGRLNHLFDGCLAHESFTLSQAFYFGKVAGGEYEAHVIAGQALDLIALPAMYPVAKANANDGTFALSDVPQDDWRGPTDDDDLIRRAMMSQSAASAFGGRVCFADLWQANEEALAKAYPSSTDRWNASQADAALASHLAFWTGRHGERVLRLMLRSGLVRDKWDREDYLPRTIAEILARPGDVLKDKPTAPAQVTPAATDAPRQRLVVGETFMGLEEQQNLFAGCVYVINAGKVLTPGGMMLDQGQFKAVYGGYTFLLDKVNDRTTRNAWECFTESQALRPPRAETICFKPDQSPAAIIDDAGKTRVNTWWPAKVRRVAGDAGPFLRHLAKMLPNERDRTILLSYMAACVQYKGVKFQWCPVLQGAEGNGKSTLLAVVSEAVGQHYTHWPKAEDLASDFNGWQANKVFIAVEELKHKDHRKADEVIENFHLLVAGGRGTSIQFKGVDQVSMAVCANVMAATNSRGAIRKTRDTARRFCIFYMAQQNYADIVAAGMGGDYFPRLYDWFNKEDGWAIVAELLHTYPIADEFNPATTVNRAPDTSSTEAVIEESRGGVEQQIAEAIAQDTPGFMGGWVSSVMLDRLVTDTLKMGNRLSLSMRRAMLQGMGYVIHPGLPEGRVNNPVLPDGRKPQLYILADHPARQLVGAAEIARAYTAAQKV